MTLFCWVDKENDTAARAHLQRELGRAVTEHLVAVITCGTPAEGIAILPRAAGPTAIVATADLVTELLSTLGVSPRHRPLDNILKKVLLLSTCKLAKLH